MAAIRDRARSRQRRVRSPARAVCQRSERGGPALRPHARTADPGLRLAALRGTGRSRGRGVEPRRPSDRRGRGDRESPGVLPRRGAAGDPREPRTPASRTSGARRIREAGSRAPGTPDRARSSLRMPRRPPRPIDAGAARPAARLLHRRPVSPVSPHGPGWPQPLGVGPVALRNRMLRMRQSLEHRLNDCLSGRPDRDDLDTSDTLITHRERASGSRAAYMTESDIDPQPARRTPACVPLGQAVGRGASRAGGGLFRRRGRCSIVWSKCSTISWTRGRAAP